MPRRREVPKREILPDPKFGNIDLAKFVNVLMLSGKKSVAENIIYGAFDYIQSKSGKDPLEVFATAINNCKPMVEVKSRRVGGANYQCRLKCVRSAVWPCLCVGCAKPQTSVARNPCSSAWVAS
jgi:ribosomal protein S7